MAAPTTVKHEEKTAADMPLLPGAAAIFGARAMEYLFAGVGGVILARVLGPDGRGVYSLINEAGALAFFPAGLGIATAGVYLAGRRRFSQQTLFSNALAWTLMLSAVYAVATAIVLVYKDSFFHLNRGQIAIAMAGGSLVWLGVTCSEYLLAQGRVGAYTTAQMATPVLRLLGIVGALTLFGLTITSAALAWLGAILLGTGMSAMLLRRRLHIRPSLNLKALRQQISFGIRSHFGWMLQAINHRFDVFLVSYYVGTAAVGQYVVGFNMAELSWWIPLALGIVLFPKASTMDAESNAAMSAAVCRRTLLLTFAVILGMAVTGNLLIRVLFGSEFGKSLAPFYILLPSGLFYTIHKVLSSSLSAQGVPQASFYGGIASVPLMIGIDFVLIPRMEIVGAAIASDVAYGVNAIVMLVLFLRETRLPLREVILFNRSDVETALSALVTLLRWRPTKLTQPYEPRTGD